MLHRPQPVAHVAAGTAGCKRCAVGLGCDCSRRMAMAFQAFRLVALQR